MASFRQFIQLFYHILRAERTFTLYLSGDPASIPESDRSSRFHPLSNPVCKPDSNPYITANRNMGCNIFVDFGRVNIYMNYAGFGCKASTLLITRSLKRHRQLSDNRNLTLHNWRTGYRAYHHSQEVWMVTGKAPIPRGRHIPGP